MNIFKRLRRAFSGRRPAPCSAPDGSSFRFNTQDEFMEHYYRNGGDQRGCAYPVVKATWNAARETVPNAHLTGQNGPGESHD